MDYNDKRRKVQNLTFKSSFGYAWSGIKCAFKEEKSMKRHFVLGSLAIIAGIICRLTITEWLWIILAIFLVTSFEMVNTAVENLVDLVTDYKYHELAKKVKDIMAGAVMWISILSVIIALLIYLPALLRLI